MRTILSTKFVAVPADVQVTVKARVVTVVGPRGTLTKSFKHQSLDIVLTGAKIRVDCWFGGKKDICCVRTIASHIENLITGVRQVRRGRRVEKSEGASREGHRGVGGGPCGENSGPACREARACCCA
jgi:hypothetical protein